MRNFFFTFAPFFLVIRFIYTYFLTHRLQLTKFILIGFTTFFINIGTCYLCYELICLDYRVAVTIAYATTVLSHFTLHGIITFSGIEKKMLHNILKYLSMLLVNYTTMLAIVWFTVNILHKSPYMGLVISTAATAAASFFTMKYFVFNSRVFG